MKKLFINIFVLSLAILLTACGNGLEIRKSASKKAITIVLLIRIQSVRIYQ